MVLETNVQDIYYAVNVKGQFLKIKYQNIFKVIYLFPSPLSPPFRYYFLFAWNLTTPLWRTLTSRSPTTVPPPPRPVNHRTAALLTDMEKFLCQREKRKKKMDETDKTACYSSPSPTASIKRHLKTTSDRKRSPHNTPRCSKTWF